MQRFDELEKVMQFARMNLAIAKMRENLEAWKARNPTKDATEKQGMLDCLEGFQLWAYELYDKAQATDRAFFKCGKMLAMENANNAKLNRVIKSMEEYEK